MELRFFLSIWSRFVFSAQNWTEQRNDTSLSVILDQAGFISQTLNNANFANFL